jgi:hypothetical protein
VSPALQTLEFNDFSGGMTDLFLQPGPDGMRKYELADNLLVSQDRGLYTRPGSVILSPDWSTALGVNYPMTELINWDNDTQLLGVSGRYMFALGDNIWQQLLGPTSNVALDAGDSDSVASWGMWRKQLYITNDAGARVTKVFKDSTDTWTVRTAGLPEVASDSVNYNSEQALAAMMVAANALYVNLSGHFGLGGPYEGFLATGEPFFNVHRVPDAESPAFFPATTTATTEAQLYALVGGMLRAFACHHRDSLNVLKYHAYYDDSASALPSSSKSWAQPEATLTTTEDPTTPLECAEAINNLLTCFNKHVGTMAIHSHMSTSPYMNYYCLPPGLPGMDLTMTGTTLVPVPTEGIEIPANYQAVFDLANAMKRSMSRHMRSTGTSGNEAHKTANILTSANSENSGDVVDVMVPDCYDMLSLFIVHHEMRRQYSYHWYDTFLGASAHDTTTTNANHALTGLYYRTQYTGVYDMGYGYGDDIALHLAGLQELQNAYNNHDADNAIHYATTGIAGQHQVPTQDTYLCNYVYGFCWFYEYTVGDVTFQDFGPVTRVQVSNTAPIGKYAQTIRRLPTLPSNPQLNWDVSAIKLKVYRSINNGSTLYLVTTLDHGTTEYTDTLRDEELATREEVYDQGGLPPNEPPPICHMMHIFKETALYGDVYDGTERFRSRLVQSIPGDPDSTPSDFTDDLDDDLVGISSTRANFIALCKKSIYRIDGGFDETGNGALTHERISDATGCVSLASIVQTDMGVFFAGNDGFYHTDGFRVTKLTRDLDKRYQSITKNEKQCKRIRGAFDPLTKRIWWTVQRNPFAATADGFWVLDLKWGLKEDAVFTSFSGGTYNYDSFRPTSVCFFDGKMHRGDPRGYVFRHEDDKSNDPVVDTTALWTDWAREGIVFRYKSCANDFSGAYRAYVPKITLQARNRSYLSLQINSINDDGSPVSLKQIRSRDQYRWRDHTLKWRPTTGTAFPWVCSGMIDAWRRFPAQHLRCDFKQIELTNAYVNVCNSDERGLGLVNAAANTVTLQLIDGCQELFHADADYFDFYVVNDDGSLVGPLHPSGGQGTTVLTLSDPDGLLDAYDGQSVKWLLQGITTNEKLDLVGYTLHYSPLGQNQKAYQGGVNSGGDVAT